MQVIVTWQRSVNADAFKPIIGTSLSTTTQLSSSTLPTLTHTRQFKSNDTKSELIKYDDNVPTETKDATPMAEALRREPPHVMLMRKRYKRPLKRFHTYSYSRPRRRPKPIYGPPQFSFGKPLNDYKFTDDFYEPTIIPPKKRKKGNPYKEYSGIVDTDIGKFYDPFQSPYEVNPYKSSSFLPSEAYLGTDFEIDETATGYDGDTGDDETAGVFKVQSSYNSDPGGPYPPSATDFDASNVNLYQTKQHTVYKTAPKSSKPKQQPKTKHNFAEPPTIDFNSLPDYQGQFNPPSVSSYNQYSYNQPSSSISGSNYNQPPSSITSSNYNQPPSSITNTNYNQPSVNYNQQSLAVPSYSQPSITNNQASSTTLNKPITTYTQPSVPNAYENVHLTSPTYNQASLPSLTFNQPLLPISAHNPKPLPPSTSYGVPIAPTLDAYQYHLASTQETHNSQINTQNYPPINFTPSQGIPQTNYVPQQIPVSDVSSKNVPNGYFAEPAGTEDEEVTYESSKIERPKKKQRQSKPGKVRIPPEKMNADEVVEYEDDQAETNDDIYQQPTLPHTYDQEEFELFAKEKRKMLLKQQQQLQKDFDKYDEFSTYFKSATSKKPGKRPAVQNTEAPDFDEDYEYDAITKPVTRRPVRAKKRRPLIPTPVPEIEYEDEDTYIPQSSLKLRKPSRLKITTQQQLRKKIPDSEPSESMEKTRKKIPTVRQQIRLTNSSNKQEVSPTKKQNSKTLERGTLTPPALGTQSDYKQYGIRSRHDNVPFKPEDAKNIFLATQRFHKPYYAYPPRYNFSAQTHGNAETDQFEYLAGESSNKNVQVIKDYNLYSEVVKEKNKYLNDDSTIRVTTTKKPDSLYVWDGKTLPKNHKLA